MKFIHITIIWGWQNIKFAINLTYGFIVSTGIAMVVGGLAGKFALTYLNNYFFPILINFIAAKVASQIIKNAANKLAKYSFAKVTKGYGWLSKAALKTSFDIPNLIFRF